LYQLGHRRIIVIAGPQEHRSHHLRLQGFCERINELGGKVSAEDIYISPTSTFDDGYKGLSFIWDRLTSEKPTAIFATNDMLALGAMQVLLQKGWKIPDDMAVVGFDNIDYSKMSHPPLTTVHVEKMRMGEDAVVLLDRLIKKEHLNPLRIEYEPKLIIRESTKGA
jgi:LacI family transcriptional regulator/LacI family purine nucleotide synthesis repressor